MLNETFPSTQRNQNVRIKVSAWHTKYMGSHTKIPFSRDLNGYVSLRNRAAIWLCIFFHHTKTEAYFICTFVQKRRKDRIWKVGKATAERETFAKPFLFRGRRVNPIWKNTLRHDRWTGEKDGIVAMCSENW